MLKTLNFKIAKIFISLIQSFLRTEARTVDFKLPTFMIEPFIKRRDIRFRRWNRNTIRYRNQNNKIYLFINIYNKFIIWTSIYAFATGNSVTKNINDDIKNCFILLMFALTLHLTILCWILIFLYFPCFVNW